VKVGICASGFGAAATPDFVASSARAAEQAGFSTIWVGEHVALFDDYSRSIYPYADFAGSGHDGAVPFPDPRTPVVDPLIAMTWAAAATSRIEVGSGILILPQRNPVVLAKQLATLDAFSDGRVALGAGLGWCREEYDAIGVPWAGRGHRMDEHLASLRLLFREDAVSFAGDVVRFQGVYIRPRRRPEGIPILVGGESDAALRRVARSGEGWIAFHLNVHEAPTRIARLRALTEAAGRNPDALRIVVGVFQHTTYDDMGRYRDAGVTEFNLCVAGSLPHDDTGLTAAIEDLALRFVDPAAGL
jgi:probable F420-dependent oxidoreductase